MINKDNGTVKQWLYAFSQTEKFLYITNYIKKKYNLDSNFFPTWDHEVIIRSVFPHRNLEDISDVPMLWKWAKEELHDNIYHRFKYNGRIFSILITKHIPIKTFYYIEYILRHTEEKYILDVGCGQNFFATFYNEIQGMEPSKVDKDLNIINEAWNDEFVQKNIEKIPNIMAISSLHHVYSLFEIPKLLEDMAKVLKSGGYCYISFNLRRLLMGTTVDEMKYNKIFTYDDINKYFKRELENQSNIELIEFSNDMDFNLPNVIISPSKNPYEAHVIKVSKDVNVNIKGLVKVDKFANPNKDPCLGRTVEGPISIIFNKKQR